MILDKLQRLVYDLDDNVVISTNSTMRQYGERQLYIIKALIAVFAILGFSGLLLTSIGIYGLISYSIAQRRNEIGIRMAVGAQRKDIVMMFLGEGLKVIIPGLLIGNIGAALIIQILSKSRAVWFIYQFIPQFSLWEPLIFICASAIIGLTTIFACYMPTLKMTFENPMTAIKQL
ncbi:MAG: FtsX-like permease family protein [Acidobacteriota bacterium]|nr:FtsX-like permease family protein [Acidobacteriota bacterium]